MIRILAVLLCLFSAPLAAQDLTALARALPDGSSVKDRFGGTTEVRLSLTQAVPYRVFTLRSPNRLVLEFEAVAFDALEPERFVQSKNVSAAHMGQLDPKTSRMVLELAAPLVVVETELQGRQDETRSLRVKLRPSGQDSFDATARVERNTVPAQVAAGLRPRNVGDRPWRIALDPGHGGIDPGADGGRKSEADLMLLFAYELRDALRATGQFEVVLTREDDVFVGLEARMTRAREGRADVFMSLHADAVLKGQAEGATIYKLSPRASNEADAKLAARHNRSDIIAGVDLTGQGDQVAEVLLDMVRRETKPRTESLAVALIEGLRGAGAVINSHPNRNGDFAVLRSADMPSVLVELGYLSNSMDLARLHSAKERQKMVQGLVAGLQSWAVDDAAQAALIRQ